MTGSRWRGTISRWLLAPGWATIIPWRQQSFPSKEGQPLTANRQPLWGWLGNRDADLVWSAVVLIAVLLPLASLTLDVPRYFILRSRLQLAADAAAEAAAQCVDIPHFQNTGETRLDPWCVYGDAESLFHQIAAPLRAKGYGVYLVFLGIDPALQSLTVYGQGDMPIFFALTPRLTVRVEATSVYRVVVK